MVKPPPSLVAETDNLRGILFMCLAVFLFPFMNATVKHLSTDYPTPMIVWVRYLGHFLFMLLAFLPAHGGALFRTRRLGVQTFRSLLLLASTVCYFTALAYVPLATAAVIGFTAPFIVTALSGPVLNERVGWRRWAAVVAGFVGVLIVIRPGGGALHWAALLVLGTAGCYALYQVLTRRIAGADPPATTITYTALFGALLTSLVGPLYWVTPVSLLDAGLFLSTGLIGGFGHYFVVRAYQYGQASVVAPLAYGQLVNAVWLGYALFGDLPDAWTWFGTGIIVGCGLYIGYRERGGQNKPKRNG